MQESQARQQATVLAQLEADREAACEKAIRDDSAAERIREAIFEFQRQQMNAQAATNGVLLKVGKASGDQGRRVKTEM